MSENDAEGRDRDGDDNVGVGADEDDDDDGDHHKMFTTLWGRSLHVIKVVRTLQKLQC